MAGLHGCTAEFNTVTEVNLKDNSWNSSTPLWTNNNKNHYFSSLWKFTTGHFTSIIALAFAYIQYKYANKIVTFLLCTVVSNRQNTISQLRELRLKTKKKAFKHKRDKIKKRIYSTVSTPSVVLRCTCHKYASKNY